MASKKLDKVISQRGHRLVLRALLVPTEDLQPLNSRLRDGLLQLSPYPLHIGDELTERLILPRRGSTHSELPTSGRCAITTTSDAAGASLQ